MGSAWGWRCSVFGVFGDLTTLRIGDFTDGEYVCGLKGLSRHTCCLRNRVSGYLLRIGAKKTRSVNSGMNKTQAHCVSERKKISVKISALSMHSPETGFHNGCQRRSDEAGALDVKIGGFCLWWSIWELSNGKDERVQR